jgi:tRNA (cytidine/uridine-2'-O-)-methyltransferase
MSQVTSSPLVHIVLYQPEIPGNTGAVGRTCVGLDAKLWLVRPLGFRIDEKTLRRAGLDYWPHLDWEVVNDWEDLLARFACPTLDASTEASDGPSELKRNVELPSPNFWFLTKTATRSVYATTFSRGDVFVFGPETAGLPPSMLDTYREQLLRIPTTPRVRSLNLATSAAICAYEAFRQLNPPDLIDLP